MVGTLLMLFDSSQFCEIGAIILNLQVKLLKFREVKN